MPQPAYPSRALLTERQLARWYERPSPADSTALVERDSAIWQRARDWGDQSGLSDARFELDELEGDRLHQAEDRLLLMVGTLCVRNGQTALWSSIFAASRPGLSTDPGDELEYLEDATARARAGQL